MAEIIKEILKKDYLKAILYNNSVIEIIWNDSIDTIEVVHLTKMNEAISELGNRKKMPLLFAPHDFMQVSRDAGKYAVSEEGKRYNLSSAVITPNLAKKIIFMFYMNINKPIVPTKAFTNKEDAFIWLEEILKNQ